MLVAPNGAQILQDDLSVTVEKEDEKEKTRRQKGNMKRSKEQHRKQEKPGSGACEWVVGHVRCSQGRLPDAAVPRLKVCVQNTQRIAMVPKGTNPAGSRNTSHPVFERRYSFFK